jgi:hypothetical protein
VVLICIVNCDCCDDDEHTFLDGEVTLYLSCCDPQPSQPFESYPSGGNNISQRLSENLHKRDRVTLFERQLTPYICAVTKSRGRESWVTLRLSRVWNALSFLMSKSKGAVGRPSDFQSQATPGSCQQFEALHWPGERYRA